MREISVFVDESGDQAGCSKYYALTLVFHDQSFPIDACLEKHRRGLLARGLPDVPFHAGPLMTGHDEYEGMDIKTRKMLFSLFFIDVQHLPIMYRTFIYRRREFPEESELSNRMRQDLVNFLFEHLSFFQSFDTVKVYYDGGQRIVGEALRGAIEYVLAKDSYAYRKTKASDYMLEQAADMLCALELVAVKFKSREASRTDEKFFGCARSFKNNYMKAIKRKRMK